MDDDKLVKLAELILLSAETAKLFSDTKEKGNGYISRITQIAQQIEAAGKELKEIGLAAPNKTT